MVVKPRPEMGRMSRAPSHVLFRQWTALSLKTVAAAGEILSRGPLMAEEVRRVSDSASTGTLHESGSLGALGVDARGELAGELNMLLADSYAIEVRTLLCQSNASGLHSHSLQYLLEQHTATLHASTRRLAARVCRIGAAPLSTLDDLARHQRLVIAQTADSAGLARLFELLEINRQLAEYLREAHALFDAHGDVTGARLIADLLEGAEHRSFQLFQLAK